MTARDRIKISFQFCKSAVTGKIENHPQKEEATFSVVELVSFKDVAATLEQRCGHLRHNAWLIDAR